MPKVIQNHAFGGLGLLLWRLGSSWRGVGTSWCDLGELLGRLGSQFSVSLEPSWRQDGPKLVPRCSKLAPEWSSGCHLRAILLISGAIFPKIAKVENRTTIHQFCHILGSWRVWLEGLGSYFERSWPQVPLSWTILASSWKFLGKLLPQRWRH